MEEKKNADPGSEAGMTNRDSPTPGPSGKREGRKAPRWTIAFLRALERTGEVEAAARDAGIDKSTAYLRRKAHPDFAEEWEEALRLRSARAGQDLDFAACFGLRRRSPPSDGNKGGSRNKSAWPGLPDTGP